MVPICQHYRLSCGLRLNVTVSPHCGTARSPPQRPLSSGITLGKSSKDTHHNLRVSSDSLPSLACRFATYNTLDEKLPEPQTFMQELARQAFIGFVASVISDTVSNSLRVVKTYRQVDEERVGYCEPLHPC